MIDTLVLKIASRCNLNCSYCYMYNLGDLTYKNQPKIMNDNLIDILIKRTKSYIEKYNLKNFNIVFHGGEPLLVPLEWFKNFHGKINNEIKDIKINLSLQTNGILYTSEIAHELKRLNIQVGISWDGPKNIHDKFRVHHNGKGSYDQVIDAFKLQKKINGYSSGLSVINAEVEPLVYYNDVKNIGITSFTLLIPQLHHDTSKEFNHFNYIQKELTFGKWLCKLFDIWWNDHSIDKPNIVYFNNYLSRIIREEEINEEFNDGEANVIVIETDGSIEASPALKSIQHAYTKEGNNISKVSLEEGIANSELIKICSTNKENLNSECKKCSIRRVCGAGRINERYSKDKEFNNISVYCNDYKLLITHIQNELLNVLSKKDLEELEINKIKYEDL